VKNIFFGGLRKGEQKFLFLQNKVPTVSLLEIYFQISLPKKNAEKKYHFDT